MDIGNFGIRLLLKQDQLTMQTSKVEMKKLFRPLVLKMIAGWLITLVSCHTNCAEKTVLNKMQTVGPWRMMVTMVILKQVKMIYLCKLEHTRPTREGMKTNMMVHAMVRVEEVNSVLPVFQCLQPIGRIEIRRKRGPVKRMVEVILPPASLRRM